MTDDLRWAARYAFCEELWRDRPRIVWDRRVESALWSAPPDEGRAEPDALASLLDALLPRRAAAGERAASRIDVSMGVADDAIGRRLAPRRPGTQFLGLTALCDAIRRRNWEVALIDVSDLLVHDGMGGAARLSVQGTELVAALASRVGEGGRTVILSVAADAGAPTEWSRVRKGEPSVGTLDYGAWLQLLSVVAPDGPAARVYGLLRPTMAAIVELPAEDTDDPEAAEATMEHAKSGPPPDGTLPIAAMRGIRKQESDEEAKTADVSSPPPGSTARRGSGAWRDGKPRAARWSSEAEVERTTPQPPASPDPSAGDDDEDVPLSYDNTLGSQQPTLLEYIAIVGAAAGATDDGGPGVELAEGMTLIELPDPAATAQITAPGVGASARGGGEATSGMLRARLVEAQRQADLAAIERQGLLERLDALDSVNLELRVEATELRDRLARALAEPGAPAGSKPASAAAPDVSERLDVALAQAQTLRWQLTQTQRSLDAARARPVELLESRLARLTALLGPGVAEAAEEPLAVPSATAEVSPPLTGLSSGALGRANGSARAVTGHAPAMFALIASVDALQRRLERSDISALQLRQGLLAVRRELARLLPDKR